jgi:hypothetical protein
MPARLSHSGRDVNKITEKIIQCASIKEWYKEGCQWILAQRFSFFISVALYGKRYKCSLPHLISPLNQGNHLFSEENYGCIYRRGL